MKTRFYKPILLCSFMMGIILLNSCKKVQQNDPAQDLASKKEQDARIENIRKQRAEIGGDRQIINVNKKVEASWVDKNDNPIDAKRLAGKSGGGCTNFDYPDYITLVRYARVYDCEANSGNGGYHIQWEYELSWSKPVVPSNSGGVYTEGYVYFFNNTTNNVDLLVFALNKVEITDLGVGPYAPNHKYKVVFETDKNDIDTYFLNGGIFSYTLKLNARFASNCPDDAGLFTLSPSWFGFTSSTGNSPCERTDEVYFIQNFYYPATHKIGIAGIDEGSMCPTFSSPFTRTDYQEVNWTDDNGATWHVFPTASGSPGTPSFISDGFIKNTDQATYDFGVAGFSHIILRYRNWSWTAGVPSPLHYPDATNACSSPYQSADGTGGPTTWTYKDLGVVSH